MLKNKTIALYGLGTETQRFLSDHGYELSIVGLLDGFRTDGSIYGYPIIPIEETIEKSVGCIIVVARPGSCKAITKRIGDFCRQNGIELFDVRGRDLLAPADVAYDFSAISAGGIKELRAKIDKADIVSFDLFDTLVARKVYQYTDIFELVDLKLQSMQIVIPDLPHLRLSAEKELSKDRSPRLIEIYEDVLNRAGISDVPAQKLCDIEWEIDQAVMIARDAVVTILREAVSTGKDVVITSDCYYDRAKIEEILGRLKITGYKKLFVSCEYKTLKTQKLFDELMDQYHGKKILHIGDDEKADIESAALRGIDTFRLYGGIQLYDALGGLGIEDCTDTLADRVKVGLFIARIFNDPFMFEDPDRRVSVKDAEDIGYLFCAPMITDFVCWMIERMKTDGIDQLLLGARDGYLLQKLYELEKTNGRSFYFHTSRTAAIRVGMQSPKDIDYVESMKFSGTANEAVKVRFGIDISDQSKALVDELILKKAEKQKENYRKYIDRLGIEKTDVAFFDFVAKGTTQMYLQRLFSQHMKGYYFLQLEPEFMADKGLDIEPFYSNEEKDTSAIFDNYYILETVLTAPDPQMLEMDDNGEPVFAKETRSAKDLSVFERAQHGIIGYFKDYLAILPKEARCNNKMIDERFLSLINKVSILDEDFLSIKVEDPFFGRMTDIRDVIG